MCDWKVRFNCAFEPNPNFQRWTRRPRVSLESNLDVFRHSNWFNCWKLKVAPMFTITRQSWCSNIHTLTRTNMNTLCMESMEPTNILTYKYFDQTTSQMEVPLTWTSSAPSFQFSKFNLKPCWHNLNFHQCNTWVSSIPTPIWNHIRINGSSIICFHLICSLRWPSPRIWMSKLTIF